MKFFEMLINDDHDQSVLYYVCFISCYWIHLIQLQTLQEWNCLKRPFGPILANPYHT